jgi:hypothetical protein
LVGRFPWTAIPATANRSVCCHHHDISPAARMSRALLPELQRVLIGARRRCEAKRV